jgi:general secretion pathway protein L
VWSEETQDVIASGELLGLSQLPEIASYASGRAVTILVDGSDITILHHQMPSKPNRQLLNALPFMLEEELAEDIEKLHFTVLDSGVDEESNQHWINVAVIKKSLLEAWLRAFEDEQIPVQKVIPESLCLNSSEQHDLSLLAMNNGWLVRHKNNIASFIDSAWLNIMVGRLTLGGTPLSINAFSPVPEFVRENDHVTVSEEPVGMPLLQLAKGAEQNKTNLLHGPFQIKKTVNKTWLMWRPLAAVFAVVMLFSATESLLVGVKANQQVEELKLQLAEQYKQAFPKETPRLNIIRTQLRRKVNNVLSGSGGSDSDFLQSVNSMTPALAANRSVSLESMRFEAKRSELRIQAKAEGFQAFEKFRKDLEAQGFDVKQGTLNNDDGKVVGILILKGAN